MGIGNILAEIGENYVRARKQPFKNHRLARVLTHDAKHEVLSVLGKRSLRATGSPGKGQWTPSPWIAIFDPRITTTAQRGYYVVYLFESDMKGVVLSLNQGMTAVKKEFKGSFTAARAELRRRASLIRSRLPEFKSDFSAKKIDIKAVGDAAAYEDAHAFGKRYAINDLPFEEILISDLKRITELYLMLISRGGIETFGDQTEEEKDAGANTITERRRYRLHRQIDRDSTAAVKAKKALGYVCQACSIDFEAVYGVVGRNYIEAHHLVPLSELPENQETPLNPKEDFAVLCANCHRMIHRKDAPRDISNFSRLGNLNALRNYFNSKK